MDSQILTSLMTCERLTDFRFNLNLYPIKGKSNSLECGSIVHTFLENYYKNIIKGLDKKQAFGYAITSAELYIKGCPFCTGFTPFHFTDNDGNTEPHTCNEMCRMKPKCGHKVDDYPGVKNTPPDSEQYKTGWKYVLATCEQYHEFYKNDHWVPLECEVVKSRILFEDDEIRVLWKAKLDWTVDTNQGIYPVDHKTMKQNRQTPNLNNQFMGQCIIMGTQNVIINKIGFQTTLKPEEKFIRTPVSYTMQRLLEWQGEILPFYAKLMLMYDEMGYWPPRYSNCEGKFGPCAFRGVCEANPDMREELLKSQFIVGSAWNPTNEGDE
jgi:hypothetical protein